MNPTDLHNQHVAILGGGRSGLAAARLAVARGAAGVVVFDTASGAAGDRVIEAARAIPGVTARVGADAVGLTRPFDLLVCSPGIPMESGWGARMASGARLAIGEVEFASWFFSGRIIGITGTNGKTTTTEMTRDLLLAAGCRALAAGNYGLPLSEVVTNHPEADTLALELSSFQLETIRGFRPDVAVWLNFAPDHMDRYVCLADYRAAKERIYENLRPQDAAVVPPEEASRAAARGARVITFGIDDPAADWHVSGNWVCHAGEKCLDLDAIAARDRHNHANVLASLAAVDALGVPTTAARDVFSRYLPPPHRYERVATHGAVEFINDSKSTNLHSLETALRAETRPLVLIAGGKDKGLDYTPLGALVGARCRAVVAIGEIRPALRAAWSAHTTIHEAGDFSGAVAMAASLARPGDTVLLSPGTSSFDMFRDYTHRGDVFRQLAQTIADPPTNASKP